MDSKQVLENVEQIHLNMKLDREQVFNIIEETIVPAARKHSPDDADIVAHVDRQTGEISVYRDNVPLSTEEIAERVGAQSFRQMFTQKLRDAVKDLNYDEYSTQLNQLVYGVVNRIEPNRILVTLGAGVEACLPRSEQIQGESFRLDSRIAAVITEVSKNGNNQKIRITLSRSRPLFLKSLFEQEIPEINEGLIEIKEVVRDPGHRSKIAVYSHDQRLDVVGACIGPRGARIRAIRDELNSGEQIDVIPWSSDKEEFIRNALKPAMVEEIILCPVLGRAVVLVQEDDPRSGSDEDMRNSQRSLAIGRRGQNVNLASRLCGWDIEIMTQNELQDALDRMIEEFASIPGVTEELADHLVSVGFISYDDLSIIEPPYLMELGGLSEEEATAIIDVATARAEVETVNEAADDAVKARKNAERAFERMKAALDDASDAAVVGRAHRAESDAVAFARGVRNEAAAARTAYEEAQKAAGYAEGCDTSEAVETARQAAAAASLLADEASKATAKFQNREDSRGGRGDRGRNNGSRSRYSDGGSRYRE